MELKILTLAFLISLSSGKQEFPIREFFDDEIKSIVVGNETLTVFTSTVNQPGEYLCKANRFCCTCSDDCIRYHDCCIDRLWNQSDPIVLETYINSFLEEAKKYTQTSCHKVLPSGFQVNGHTSEYIYMVTTCSARASIEDTNQCLNPTQQTNEHIIPVLGDDGFIYKNSYCARCNFIAVFEIVNITADCFSSEPLIHTFVIIYDDNSTITTTTTTTTANPNILQRYDGCRFEVVRNNFTRQFIKPCVSDYSRDGCVKGNPYYDLCHAYTGYYQSEWNYHCYLCKSSNPEKEKLDPRLYQCRSDSHESRVGTWSHVLNLNFGSTGGISVRGLAGRSSSASGCLEGYYNILTQQCETYSCKEGYERVGSTCIQNVYLENPTFENCLLQGTGGYFYFIANNWTDVNLLHGFLNKTIAETFPGVTIFYQNETHIVFELHIQKTDNITLETFLRNISLPNNQLWSNFSNIILLSNKVQLSELYKFDVERSFQGERFCVEPIVLQDVNNTITSQCHYTRNNETFHYLNATFSIRLSRYHNTRYISLCQDFHLHSKCALTTITSNYTIKNKTLVTRPDNKVFPPSSYAPLEIGVGFCDAIRDPLADWLEISNDIEYYFSVIVTAISVVCLALISLTYCSFKELRTLPGLNVIGLCLTLIATDITFIVSIATDINKTHCRNIAVFLHWGLLVSYFWIIVITVDLTVTFRTQTRAMSTSIGKTFIRYTIFAIMGPTVIVSIAVALDESNTYNFGYGENNVCFISYLYARLYFFAIPVLLINLVTVIAFTIVLISIYRTDKISQKTLHKKKSLNLLKIGIKLAVILGLIELIGFFQISKSSLTEGERYFNSVSALLYTVVRSMKGIFLFCVYMLNKQKYKLVLKKLKMLRGRAQTLTFELTSSTT